MPELDEDDFIDGCDVDFTLDPDDDETAELRALFPDGVVDQAKADEWNQLALDVADGKFGLVEL